MASTYTKDDLNNIFVAFGIDPPRSRSSSSSRQLYTYSKNIRFVDSVPLPRSRGSASIRFRHMTQNNDEYLVVLGPTSSTELASSSNNLQPDENMMMLSSICEISASNIEPSFHLSPQHHQPLFLSDRSGLSFPISSGRSIATENDKKIQQEQEDPPNSQIVRKKTKFKWFEMFYSARSSLGHFDSTVRTIKQRGERISTRALPSPHHPSIRETSLADKTHFGCNCISRSGASSEDS